MIHFYVTILLLLVEVDFYKLFFFTQEIFCFVEVHGFLLQAQHKKPFKHEKKKYLQNQTALFLKKVFPLTCSTHAMTNIN